MKKILVVGGAGYIGSHVVKAILEAGFAVKVFDNLSTGQEINLFKEAEFVKGDILDKNAISSAMQGVDGVVHLAAKKAVGESMQNPDLYAENNIEGTINILVAMNKAGVKNIVFSSSSSVYGNPNYLPIDESHPIQPVSFYGYTKAKIDELLEWYDRLKGIKYASLRYFNAVGYDETGTIKGREKDVQNLLPIAIQVLDGERECLQVFGNDYDTEDGTCVRDYVHVSDLASAHVLAMKRMMDGGDSQVFNLGTGKGTSVNEIIESVNRVFNVGLSIKYAGRRDGDPAKLYASSKKAKEMLGWEPKFTDIDDIVKTSR
ncbi:MAG: UDP-glucose 4-epimerase GalE [Lactobacillus sp.]|jgi:UDP-glucose 4-epimerase|nr:UDP-glucose 4-epimerase GalE [Lactobacillus sp.]